jgi:hypothetical protein
MTSKDDGLRTSRYWRERAEEARVRASEMHNHDAELAMLSIAATYDRMAERAAQRETKLQQQ